MLFSGNFMKWAVVFLIVFVLFFLLIPDHKTRMGNVTDMGPGGYVG